MGFRALVEQLESPQASPATRAITKWAERLELVVDFATLQTIRHDLMSRVADRTEHAGVRWRLGLILASMTSRWRGAESYWRWLREQEREAARDVLPATGMAAELDETALSLVPWISGEWLPQAIVESPDGGSVEGGRLQTLVADCAAAGSDTWVLLRIASWLVRLYGPKSLQALPSSVRDRLAAAQHQQDQRTAGPVTAERETLRVVAHLWPEEHRSLMLFELWRRRETTADIRDMCEMALAALPDPDIDALVETALAETFTSSERDALIQMRDARMAQQFLTSLSNRG